jgi:acyl-coenzyme A thioesterase PaaI-like protein
MSQQSLQEQFSPAGICFGCGPANSQGLQIRSFTQGEEVIADWQPKTYHQAFPGVINGGIIGALLDCHCNWTAAYHLMKATHLDSPPCTVTADYAIKLLRPTPADDNLHLIAKIISLDGDKAKVYGELHAKGKLCATCEGTFVAVKPGHPAYHRW